MIDSTILKYLMSIELTEEQLLLLKELRSNDPEPVYRGFSDQPASSKSIEEPELARPSVEIMYDVDYDS